MIKNEILEKYTTKVKSLFIEAEMDGINIQPYEKKIKKGDSEIVVEHGIAIFTCSNDIKCIPTWKLSE